MVDMVRVYSIVDMVRVDFMVDMVRVDSIVDMLRVDSMVDMVRVDSMVDDRNFIWFNYIMCVALKIWQHNIKGKVPCYRLH